MPALISPFLRASAPCSMLGVRLFVLRCFSEQIKLLGLLGARVQADLRRLLDTMLDTYAAVAARPPTALARSAE